MGLFTVQSSALLSLDDLVFQHNVRFWSFYQRRINARPLNYAILDRLIDDGTRLRRAAAELAEASLAPFDQLVLRHIRANLEAQDAFLQYWFLGGITKVEVLTEQVFGPAALPQLKTLFANYDFETEARLIDLESTIKPSLMTPGHPRVVRTINALIPVLLDELIDFARHGGAIPALAAAQLPAEGIGVVLRTSVNARGAAWYERSRTVELSAREFHVYRSTDRFLINPGLAIMTLAHEVLGHAVNGVCSSWMPQTVSGSDENLTNITSMPMVEGFALDQEHLGKAFLISRQDGLAFEVHETEVRRRALRQDEIELATLLNRTEDLERTLRCYAAYARLKQMDDPSFSARKMMEDEWRGHLTRSRYRIVDKCPVDLTPPSAEAVDFLYDLSYLLGPRLVQETLGLVQAEFGEDFMVQHHDLISHVMCTGTWAAPVYSDWVLFALQHRAQFLEEATAALTSMGSDTALR